MARAEGDVEQAVSRDSRLLPEEMIRALLSALERRDGGAPRGRLTRGPCGLLEGRSCRSTDLGGPLSIVSSTCRSWASLRTAHMILPILTHISQPTLFYTSVTLFLHRHRLCSRGASP